MFFLYHRSVLPTGRILGRALGGRWGTLRFMRDIPDLLIRWGSAETASATQTINTASAISAAGDKLRSLQIMQEAGVPVIPFYTSILNVPEGTAFGRRRHHTRGSDIQIIDTPRLTAGVPGCDFFTQYIAPRHEYRIHVVNGEVIRSQIKVPTEGADPNGMIRNRANGWIMNGMNTIRPNQDRLDAAIAAVQALDLDFGAVDLLVGREDNQPYVLEVNTAPRCDATTGRAYVEALARLADERGVALTPRYEALEALRDHA